MIKNSLPLQRVKKETFIFFRKLIHGLHLLGVLFSCIASNTLKFIIRTIFL